MQAVIPVMRQQGGGTIINISSVAGHIPLPFHAAYSATKFAMNAIGKAAGVELKKDGIHVLTVCPGYVRTAFGQNVVLGNEQKTVRPRSVRGITAERVARATLRGYLKQKREVIVPWTMYVPQKIYQLFPATGGAGDGPDGEMIRGQSGFIAKLSQFCQHGFHFRLRVKVPGASGGGDSVGQHGLRLGDCDRREPAFARP